MVNFFELCVIEFRSNLENIPLNSLTRYILQWKCEKLSSEWRIRPASSAFIRGLMRSVFKRLRLISRVGPGEQVPRLVRVLCVVLLVSNCWELDLMGGGEKPPFSFYAVIKVASTASECSLLLLLLAATIRRSVLYTYVSKN